MEEGKKKYKYIKKTSEGIETIEVTNEDLTPKETRMFLSELIENFNNYPSKVRAEFVLRLLDQVMEETQNGGMRDLKA